jgi:hypothetical protein
MASVRTTALLTMALGALWPAAARSQAALRPADRRPGPDAVTMDPHNDTDDSHAAVQFVSTLTTYKT